MKSKAFRGQSQAFVPAQSVRALIRTAAKAEGEEKRGEVVWTTGAKVLRRPWFGEDYLEALSMDPAHVRMGRINSGTAPFLDSHNQNKLADILGVVESATIQGDEGRAAIRFSARADVEGIVKDIEAGIISNVSVGYLVHKYERQPMAEGESVPTYLAVDWEPFEISAVPIGADPDAGFRSQSGRGVECQLQLMMNDEAAQERGLEEKKEMDPITQPVIDIESEKKAATQAERKRAGDIKAAVRTAKLTDEFADKLIEAGVSIDEARKQIIDEWAARSASPVVQSQVRVEAGSLDAQQTMRSGIENAILIRSGIEKAPTEQGRRFVGLSLIEMARQVTGMHSGTKNDVALRAMSSSDFPLILGNVSEKMLMKAYTVLGKTFAPLVAPGILTDYKPAKRYQIGDAPSLEEIAEGGEYKAGKFGEKAEAVQLKDYGKKLMFTRQMLINDDLAAFQSVINNFGSAAGRLEHKLVYGILTSNPTMGDGVALFHASHGNLLSASVIDVDNLALAEKAILDQLTLDGADFLGIAPKVLWCGTAKKVQAQKILAAQVIPGKAADVNPFMGALTLVVDPRITGNKWGLSASPNDIATIEVAYLEGESGPVVDSKEEFDSDGLAVKCRHTVSVKALEWKGLAYNPGA